MGELVHRFVAESEVPPPMELALELPLSADLAPRWEALHETAREIARLGQLGAERPCAQVVGFAENAWAAPQWRGALADRALADLMAVVSPGLAALRSIEAEGRDPTAAAVMLWREFHRARASILHLVAPDTYPAN